MGYSRIEPSDLFRSKTAQTCVVDVRTAAEFKAESLPDCINIALHDLTAERLHAELQKRGLSTETIYLLCQSGRRSEIAAHQLLGNFAGTLCVIEGGMDAVKKVQVPVQQSGNKVMSLDRQVRIAAGALVLVGVISGSLFSNLFYGLAAFVGAGLLFAGITNTCMMGMLIARMPWNR
jgi:rhodanese-related sulfurtransferase